MDRISPPLRIETEPKKSDPGESPQQITAFGVPSVNLKVLGPPVERLE